MKAVKPFGGAVDSVKAAKPFGVALGANSEMVMMCLLAVRWVRPDHIVLTSSLPKPMVALLERTRRMGVGTLWRMELLRA